METATLHQAMLCPATYQNETEPITFAETHISRLYFTQKHVYKVKKPVDFGFLDFTTLKNRHSFCLAEVALNARYCPDTYLDVVEIRQTEEGWRIGPGHPGQIVEYAVRMNRLPQQHMLDVQIAREDPGLTDEMERLGRHLARLHLQAPPHRETGNVSDLERIHYNWSENLRQTAPFVGDTLLSEAQSLMTTYVGQFLSRSANLLKHREESGCIIDGHGDLHAEHICLTDPICIYDCIEFNDRFRIGDRVADLAFLLMDLEQRDRKDLAETLATAYLDTIGGDPDFIILVRFYKIYRAWVRGKVMSFTSKDPGLATKAKDAARAQAQSYFNQAIGYLCPPSLLITCGLMGVGKTSIATPTAQALQGALLRSDVRRKKLRGMDPNERATELFGTGIYSEAQTRQTYLALRNDTIGHLARGTTVFVDASFMRRAYREAFRRAAARCQVPFRIIWITNTEDSIRQRLRLRQSHGRDASDGREDLLDQQKFQFEPPTHENHVMIIDSSKPIAFNVQTILCNLAQPSGL